MCLSVCLDVTWGNGRGCCLVVNYWADLQLVRRFHCYDNIAIAPIAKCQRVLLLALCLVVIVAADSGTAVLVFLCLFLVSSVLNLISWKSVNVFDQISRMHSTI